MERKYLSFLTDYTNIIGNVEGVNESVVESIEKSLEVQLPISYKEFLLSLGKESGNVLSSYYVEYPILLENKPDAIDVINFDDRKEENEKPLLKKSYFFFAQWQGYVFYFFDCEDGDNPPVFILSDSLEIKKYKDCFTDFLFDEGIKPLMKI